MLGEKRPPIFNAPEVMVSVEPLAYSKLVCADVPTFTVPPESERVPPLREKSALVFNVPPPVTVSVPPELTVTVLSVPALGAVAESVG